MLHLFAQAATPTEPVDDVSPMMLALLCAAAGLMVWVGVAVLMACVCLAALAILLAAALAGTTLAGIGASSVAVGLRQGRFFAFFHALCLQLAAVSGLLGGLGIGAGVKLATADTSWAKALGLGALIGGLLGALAGHGFANGCRWVLAQWIGPEKEKPL